MRVISDSSNMSYSSDMSDLAAPIKGYDLEAARREPKALRAEPVAEAEALETRRPKGSLTWVKVVARDRAAAEKLLIEGFGFHELPVEDALTAGERPHLHEEDNYLFLTAPAVRVEAPKLYFDEVGVFVCVGLIVTVTTVPCDLVERWFRRWQSSAHGLGTDAAMLLHTLIDAIVDEYFPALDVLEAQATELETGVFRGKQLQIKDILRLKRRLLELRRRLSPFRDVVNGLLRRDVALIGREAKPYFQDVYDHTLRILEATDLNREILATLLEAHLANVSNQLNQTMRWLTAVTTILMSLALVAGWYGMNFRHMPELNSPLAYPAIFLASLLLAGIEIWLFRKKGWL